MKCQTENCSNEAISNLYICNKCMHEMAFVPVTEDENQCANGCVCNDKENN